MSLSIMIMYIIGLSVLVDPAINLSENEQKSINWFENLTRPHNRHANKLSGLLDLWANGTINTLVAPGALQLARYVSHTITSQIKGTTQ